MKKLIYCAAALATALFAGSCQQELLDTSAGENTVTYTVEVPGVATKAYGLGQEVNQLIYEVWKTDNTGEINDNAVRLYQVNDQTLAPVNEVKSAYITLNLVKDQTYRILLWAQVKEANGFVYYKTENLTKVSYMHNLESSYSANQEKYDAFYATKVISTFTAPKPEKISLKRPFAQLNIATENNVTDYTVTMNTSKVVVEGVPTVFNVATSEATAETTVTFNTFYVPEGTVTITTDAQSKSYDYAAMNYVFASKSGINAKVSYDINSTLTSKNLDGSNGVETEAKVSNIIPNVPLKENYRTNIVGNLLSSSTTYEIVVDADFKTDGNGDMFDINDGLIKNINGDYEISTAAGLAYAINNLFADGGTFYVLNSIDMTGVEYNPSNIPAGVTVEFVGQIPVVTRSAVEVEPITITGLEYGAIINTNDGSAIISNIAVSGSDEVAYVPAFINVNNGTADITNCGASHQSFIGENNGDVTESHNTTSENTPIIKEDNGETLTKVGTADQLVAALKANKGVIFTNDIKIEPASMSNAYGTTGINVKNGQTIDGAGYTLNIKGAGGTWDSGINTTGGLIKNITVTGSFRGIFINHNSTHSEPVVLENVTLDGVVYTISCDQGKYQSLVATNSTFKGWTSYAKTLGTAKFTNCSFGEGSGYAFCRPYAPTEFEGCKFEEGYTLDPVAAITLNNCTLNGVALTSENLGELVTNSDKAETPTSVGTADALVEALEAGEDVFFTSDIKINPANMSNAYGATGINVKNGQAIYGGGHTLDIKGAGGTWDSGISTTGGLIKDLTVTGSFRGIFINHNSEHSEKVILENVTIDGTVYTISCDQGVNQGLEAINSTFNGWTSYAKTLGTAKFTNCSFGEGQGYAFCRPYAPTEFVGCAFEAGYTVDPVAKVKFENCTINGVALTAANVATLVTSTGNVESVNGYTQVDGVWINEGTAIVTSPENVQAAFGNSEIHTIYLGEGTFVADIYNGTPARKSLTIIGSEGTKFGHTATTGGQLRLDLFESFTINNCEIIQRSGYKTWGHIVFSASGNKNGVYTIKNCTFNSNGNQGIYINENTSGAVYNIENCTFNGNFGSADGAVTIQNNPGAEFTVNVNGCTFNTTSNQICYLYADPVFTLNTDPTVTPVCLNR